MLARYTGSTHTPVGYIAVVGAAAIVMDHTEVAVAAIVVDDIAFVVVGPAAVVADPMTNSLAAGSTVIADHSS